MLRKLLILTGVVSALALYTWTALHAQGGGGQVGPPNAILCNKVSTSASLATGTTLLVPGVTGQAISLCGFIFEGLATGTVQLVFGTGSTCTTPTNITGVFNTGATSNVTDHLPSAWMSSSSGQGMCGIVGGATAVVIDTYYSQF